MSEYQYYDFLAIDRPLTEQEMAQLRAISTRATITPSSFTNVYHYGDLKAAPEKLLERYFDVFVYEANWGTHWLMLRLPMRLFDPQMASPYAVPDVLSVTTSGDHVMLELRSDDENESGWVEEEESEQWLPSLMSLRADLINGDLRSLYLGWLSFVQRGLSDDESESDDGGSELDDDDLDEDYYEDSYAEVDRNAIEPPVPLGLANLTASLHALAEFLRIDHDLMAVAAERSAAIVTPSPEEFQQWLLALPGAEKDSLLVKLLEGDNPLLRAELWQRFRQSHPAAEEQTEPAQRRTVGELLKAAREHAEKRKREEARRKAEEKAKRAREEAAARAKYLDSIVGRDEEFWRQVDILVEAKKAREYDQATQLLIGLRDLSARSGELDAFRARLAQLRDRHAKKPTFIKRLDEAKLR